MWYADNQYCVFYKVPKPTAKLISGQVVNANDDKVEIEVSSIKPCRGQVTTTKETKIALINSNTQIFRRDPAGHIINLTLRDIKSGNQATVYYSGETNGQYQAEKVELVIFSDMYRVDNLIKNIGK